MGVAFAPLGAAYADRSVVRLIDSALLAGLAPLLRKRNAQAASHATADAIAPTFNDQTKGRLSLIVQARSDLTDSTPRDHGAP
jgi:hypothetical protein